MALATTQSRQSAADGDGSTTAFSYSYKYVSSSDLKVYLYDETADTATLQTISTHYTVTATGAATNGVYPGATITFVTAPSSSYKVVIFRAPSQVQEMNLASEATPLPVATRGFDLFMMHVQRLQDQLDRTIKLPDGDYSSTWDQNYTRADWANKTILFDSSGNPAPSSAAVDPTTSFIEILVDDYLSGSNWGAAFNAAIADLPSTGGIIRVSPGTDLTIEDAQVACSKGNVVFDFRGVTIRPKYASGAAFKFGTGSAEVGRIAVLGGWFRYTSQALGGPTQALFELRGITDFITQNCSSTLLYQLCKWGDAADAQASGRWWDVNCRWLYRTNANGGHSHAILADGSNGGYYLVGSNHGGDAATIAGEVNFFQLTSAAGPSRFDGFQMNGGYLSNWDYAVKAVDQRITNFDISPASRFDEMQAHAFFIDISSGATKGGCSSVHLRGGYGGTGGCGIVRARNGHASLGLADINVDTAYTRNSTGNIIKLETTGSGVITNAHINGVSFEDYEPTDADQIAVLLDGDVRHFSVDAVSLRGKNAATYTAKYVVHDNTLATCNGYIGANIWGDVNTKVVERTNAGSLAGRSRLLPLPPGHLSGMTLANNGSDATNDIDFTAGQCLDSTGTLLIKSAAMTKRLDATWAVGTAAGGLDAGSIADVTYHCHAIQKITDGSGDFIFSLSHDKSATCTMTIASPAVVTMTAHGLVAGSPFKFTTTGALPTGVTAGTQYYVLSSGLSADAFSFATSIGGTAINSSGSQSGTHTCYPGPLMPSGYAGFRRIGSIMRASSALRAFTQRGDEFLLKVPVAAADSASPGTSAITKVLTTPVGLQTDAIITSGGVDATPAAATYGLVTALDTTETTPTSALFNWTIAATGAGNPNGGWANLRVRTNTAASIRLHVDASTADLTLKTITFGWIDTRGRQA
jgi:hypothetical protein